MELEKSTFDVPKVSRGFNIWCLVDFLMNGTESIPICRLSMEIKREREKKKRDISLCVALQFRLTVRERPQ